jgi:hypothetical protein
MQPGCVEPLSLFHIDGRMKEREVSAFDSPPRAAIVNSVFYVSGAVTQSSRKRCARRVCAARLRTRNQSHSLAAKARNDSGLAFVCIIEQKFSQREDLCELRENGAAPFMAHFNVGGMEAINVNSLFCNRL